MWKINRNKKLWPFLSWNKASGWPICIVYEQYVTAQASNRPNNKPLANKFEQNLFQIDR